MHFESSVIHMTNFSINSTCKILKNLRKFPYRDKKLDFEAVKKKWDSRIPKNLANLRGNIRNKSFLEFYVDYNGSYLIKNGSL